MSVLGGWVRLIGRIWSLAVGVVCRVAGRTGIAGVVWMWLAKGIIGMR